MRNPDRPARASFPVRVARLARALIGVIAVVPVVTAWRWCPEHWRIHRPWARLVMAMMCWAFRLRVRVRGTPLTGPALMVANHISWTDIVVLGACCDAAFVAKSEVESWPAVGILTTRHGGEYIDRGRRGDVTSRGDALIARWTGKGPHNRPYILFAEGTTSEGGEVKPFFPALFEPAVKAGVPVQPVALSYRDADGVPLGAAVLRKVAWVGDDLLAPHMLAMAMGAPLVVEVWFGPVLPAGSDRKTLARESRAAIARQLGYES